MNLNIDTYFKEREARLFADFQEYGDILREQYPGFSGTPASEEEHKISGLSEFEYTLLKCEDPVCVIIPPELHEIFVENEDVTEIEALCILGEAGALELAIPPTPAEVAALVEADEAYTAAVAEAFYGPTLEEAAAQEAELDERLLTVAAHEGPEAVEDLYRTRPDLF